nr:reverse transcriptase [Tanacetum cinerariifolium]
MQFTRVTKIEFPKFECDDVKGWMYKYEQFFKVNNVADEQKTLSVAYSLSKLQIETTEATKKKNKAPLFPTPKFNSYTSGENQISSPKPLALRAPNVNWRTKAATPQVGPVRKRLSQKEMKEKRAKILCFYYD